MDGDGLELMDIGEQTSKLLFLDIVIEFWTEIGTTGAGFTNVALWILSRSVALLMLMAAAEPRTIVLTRLLWRTWPLPVDPGGHSSDPRPREEDCIIHIKYQLVESGTHLPDLRRLKRVESNFFRRWFCVKFSV